MSLSRAVPCQFSMEGKGSRAEHRRRQRGMLQVSSLTRNPPGGCPSLLVAEHLACCP